MLGHPSGLPMKWTTSAEVKENVEQKDYFKADLDAFSGNSGSPIFSDETHQVIGMLVEGIPLGYDTKFDETQGIYVKKLHHATAEDLKKYGYEKCQKLTSLSFLNSVLLSIDISHMTFDGEIKEGLNLIAECSSSKRTIVINYGFGDSGDGKFDISQISSFAYCTCCQEKVEIDPDHANVFVISSCSYQMEGTNRWEEKIHDGSFSLLKGHTLWFDFRNWYFLELKLTPIPKINISIPSEQSSCNLF